MNLSRHEGKQEVSRIKFLDLVLYMGVIETKNGHLLNR